MPTIGFAEIWRSEIYSNVSAEDRVQDKILSLPKLKLNDSYEEKQKQQRTLNFLI